MRTGWLLLLAGCYTSKPPPTIANRVDPAEQRPAVLTITESGFGPLTAKSEATLMALRTAFAGFDVKPINDTSLSYMVYLGKEEIAWVIPNEDGSVFNVHAKSSKVATAGRTWRVGDPFRDAGDLTDCECWGTNPTCYRRGDHIAVNFKGDCDRVSSVVHARDLKFLEGIEVQRVIWSPHPFDPDEDDANASPDSP